MYKKCIKTGKIKQTRLKNIKQVKFFKIYALILCQDNKNKYYKNKYNKNKYNNRKYNIINT